MCVMMSHLNKDYSRIRPHYCAK